MVHLVGSRVDLDQYVTLPLFFQESNVQVQDGRTQTVRPLIQPHAKVVLLNFTALALTPSPRQDKLLSRVQKTFDLYNKIPSLTILSKFLFD